INLRKTCRGDRRGKQGHRVRRGVVGQALWHPRAQSPHSYRTVAAHHTLTDVGGKMDTMCSQLGADHTTSLRRLLR
ncbi:hypothetical protein J6590_104764, partial [Homalodisca vitripennis]